jgi:hypothetical protein
MHTGEGEGGHKNKSALKQEKGGPSSTPLKEFGQHPQRTPLYYGRYNKLKFDKFKKDLRF